MSQKEPPGKQWGQVKSKIRVRMSEAEARMVRRQAKKQGLTVSAYVGMLIRNHAKPPAKKRKTKKDEGRDL